MKLANKKTPLVILLLVLAIYVVSTILIYIFIPNTNERANFGDMFGAINALFSGLAIFGVVYTIYQQQEQMTAAKYEFQFNRLMGQISMQNDYLNKKLATYEFNINQDNPENAIIVNFDKAVKHFSEIKDSHRKLDTFLDINGNTIIKAHTIIFDCIEFVKSLIKKENLLVNDEEIFRKLFTRGIDHDVLEFLSMTSENLKYETAVNELRDENLKDPFSELIKLGHNRLRVIMNFLNYNASHQ